MRHCTVLSRPRRRPSSRAAAAVVGASLLWLVGSSPVAATTPIDWPTYLHDLGSSDATREGLITTANAASLRAPSGWPVQGGGSISTQPIVANNLVYWGSWDGYEHATALPGTSTAGWATNVGQTTDTGCGPATVGVASTGAVAAVTPAGQTTPRSVLFVGGGGTNAAGGGSAQLFALDALTGTVLWQTPLGPAPSNFLWGSPTVYTYPDGSGGLTTSVYIGLASFCDNPVVQGQVVQVDAANGQVQHVFDVVPGGCVGGAVWASATIDQADGSLYVATGNAGACSSAEPDAEALLKLRASDLSLLDSWQLPSGEQTVDSDFGSSATLFSGTVSTTGSVRDLVGVPNKNGTYYVFDRAQLGAGPVARLQVAAGGDCPQCGDGSISPSAWDGTTLYVAGGRTTINGTSYPGSVRAWNPNDLAAPVWERGMPDGPVLGAVAASPGLVAVGEGSYTEILDARTGNVLLRAPVESIAASSRAIFFGPPSISHGMLFEGDTNGVLYAYAPPPTVTVPWSRPFAPTTMGGSTSPIWTSWSGSAPSGIRSYLLQRQLNGGAWTTVSLPSATTTAISQSLTYGTKYRYRVQATNNVGQTSGFAYGRTFTVLASDQTSASVRFSGSWFTGYTSAAYGGSLRYATSAGASASFTFSGAAVAWVAYRGPNRGSAKVYLDGVYKATVSLYASTYAARPIVYAFRWDYDGTHTIRIVVSGTAGHPRVDVDAFVRQYLF